MSGDMGLTERMRAALNGIIGFVGRHGVMPSRRLLAAQLGCNATRANNAIASLVQRGAVSLHTDTGGLTAFGSDGVAVYLPPDVAARLCAFCDENDERPQAVAADAILLHLDAIEEVET